LRKIAGLSSADARTLEKIAEIQRSKSLFAAQDLSTGLLTALLSASRKFGGLAWNPAFVGAFIDG
jgi:hypothetical protein